MCCCRWWCRGEDRAIPQEEPPRGESLNRLALRAELFRHLKKPATSTSMSGHVSLVGASSLPLYSAAGPVLVILTTKVVLKAIRCGQPLAGCLDEVAREALINLLLTDAPGTEGMPVANCVTRLHKVVAYINPDTTSSRVVVGNEASEQRYFLLVIDLLTPGDVVVENAGQGNVGDLRAVQKSIGTVHDQTMTCWKNLAEFGFVHNDIKPNNLGFVMPSSASAHAAPLLKFFDFGFSLIVDSKDFDPKKLQGETAHQKIFGMPNQEADRIVLGQGPVVRPHGAGEKEHLVEAQRQSITAGTHVFMPPSVFSCRDTEQNPVPLSFGSEDAWHAWAAGQYGPKTDLYAIALTLNEFMREAQEFISKYPPVPETLYQLHYGHNGRNTISPCGQCPFMNEQEQLKVVKHNPSTGIREEELQVRRWTWVDQVDQLMQPLLMSAPAPYQEKPGSSYSLTDVAWTIKQHLVCAATPQWDTSSGLYDEAVYKKCASICT
eukprot:g7901.t1